MKLKIAWVGKTRQPAIASLTAEYLARIARYAPAESQEFASEAALLKNLEKTRAKPVLVLLDSRGRAMSSEAFAGFIREHQDRGTQTLVFAVGGADGFSPAARKAAQHVLSFGPMTLAHELARVVLLEQLYRAFTIIQGHPYHTSH
jgi:23S rRNA (pseudouridine1915-N3)-methyltransferase